MTEPVGTETKRELAELWREWLTQSERQMNAFFNESLSTDAAGRGMGNFVEMYALFQRNLAQAMERYLTMMNIPSRTDISALAEKLASIEHRLSRIEETLLIAAESVDSYERTDESQELARTRRPWVDGAVTSRDDMQVGAVEAEKSAATSVVGVPEELRR